MYKHQTKLRVRYSETDQMGFVYYGNYASYFEVARVEALRQLGVSYRALEQQGVWMPVLDYQVSYLKPARYDDELIVECVVAKMPAAKIVFHYHCTNQQGEKICNASTTLVFMDAKTEKPMRPPTILIEKLQNYFTV